VNCGARGRCRGLKVVPSCSQDGTSYSLLQTLLLQDVSLIHTVVGCFVQQKHTAETNLRNFRIWNIHGQRGIVTMAIADAEFSAVRFCRAKPYVVRSAIGLLSDSYFSCLRINSYVETLSKNTRNSCDRLHDF